MAGTYTQLYIQFVFAVKFRAALIHNTWEDQLYKYITGIVQKRGHKMLQINGMPDHIHLLVGFNPKESISNLIQKIKSNSSLWVNKSRLCNSRFQWQEGYGAFSHSKDSLPNVIRYIENQKSHHKKMSMREEYQLLLKKYGIEYDERYVFNDPE
ncbi:MAG: IS200/IS605 family transposase [Chitinophagaceae bacterium]|nr:IS200/IS605 family transposase [Chitinophagaceae bacterium]